MITIFFFFDKVKSFKKVVIGGHIVLSIGLCCIKPEANSIDPMMYFCV